MKTERHTRKIPSIEPKLLLAAVAAAGIILNAVWFSMKLYPDISAWASARAEHDRLQRRVMALESEPITPAIDRARLEQLTRQIPIEPGLPQLLTFWEQTAAETGIELKSVTFNEQSLSSGNGSGNPTVPAAEELRIEMNAAGRYEGLVRFYELLLATERIVKVNDWSLNAEREGDLTLRISMSVYSAGDYSALTHPESNGSSVPSQSEPPHDLTGSPTLSEQQFLEKLKGSP